MTNKQNLKFQKGKIFVIGFPYLWVGFFFLLPFLVITALSFSETIDSIPPYKFFISYAKNWNINSNLSNYKLILKEKLYFFAFIESVKIALFSTIAALFLGYPIAYGIAQSTRKKQILLLVLLLIPFFTSSLIRVYCWMTILKTEGLINNLLIYFHIISEPLKILNTKLAVIIGITYSYLPFMVLPLYSALEKINPQIIEAATDLGAKPFAVFREIIIPLSLNGIISGCLMVFIPSIGEFVIPEILGGSSVITIGKVIWNEFFLNRDWPMASTLAVCITFIIVIPIIYIQKKFESEDE